MKIFTIEKTVKEGTEIKEFKNEKAKFTAYYNDIGRHVKGGKRRNVQIKRLNGNSYKYIKYATIGESRNHNPRLEETVDKNNREEAIIFLKPIPNDWEHISLENKKDLKILLEGKWADGFEGTKSTAEHFLLILKKNESLILKIVKDNKERKEKYIFDGEKIIKK